jgi:hypothetical protein
MTYSQTGLKLVENAIDYLRFSCSVSTTKTGPHLQQNNTFFAFSLIIEGATEKVLQFIMPHKSICNKNFGFNDQKMFFEHYREFQARKTLLIDIIFAMKNIVLTFPELSPLCLC